MLSPRGLLFAATSLLLLACSSPEPASGTDSSLVSGGTSAGGAGAESAHPKFGLPELQVMVRELLEIAPENPAYAYPAEIQMVENDATGGNAVVNAQAGVTPRDGKLVPFVRMYRGLADVADNDPRVLRAVLAHEIAHLSLGHAIENSSLSDVQHFHTRQEERAADELGARLLEQLGGSREDMVDMLQMLDRHMKDNRVPWIASVAGDHASCITRASYLVPDDALLASVSRFEIGLMFMECRCYDRAIGYFDQALELQPELHEARLNAASASLQNYYDRLPAAVQDAWLRPEFGPNLTDVRALAGRSIEVTPLDLERYAQALERIDACAPNWYATMRRYLKATAQVLHPTGDAATVAAGVEELRAMQKLANAGTWGFDTLKLGIANNLALGLARSGRDAEAMRVLIGAQSADLRVVPSMAGNLSRLPSAALSKEQAKTALVVLLHLVQFSPEGTPDAKAASQAVTRIANQHGYTTPDTKSKVPLAYCAVASMTIDGHEIGLFDHFTAMAEVLGPHDGAGRVSATYDNLHFVTWRERAVIALAENDRLVKLTSYRPGSYLTLQPARRSTRSEPRRVSIGMKKTELDALLAPAGGDAGLKSKMVYLLDRTAFRGDEDPAPKAEPWRYYPTLNFGVSIRDGAVAGIAVTPVK